MSKYRYEAGGIIRDLILDIPYHTDDIVDLLTGKDLHIAELQKQLEEKTKTIEGLIEEQKNIENSASYQMFLDYQKQLEEKEKELREIRVENYTIKSYRDFLDNKCKNLIKENKKLKQQLKSQLAEIVEKIYEYLTQEENWKQLRKVWLNNGECEYLRKSLDTILKEYQK